MVYLYDTVTLMDDTFRTEYFLAKELELNASMVRDYLERDSKKLFENRYLIAMSPIGLIDKVNAYNDYMKSFYRKDEYWRPMSEHNSEYLISSYARIKHRKTKRYLKPFAFYKKKKGVLKVVCLRVVIDKKYYSIGRLMQLYFFDNKEGKVYRKNGNPIDNSIDNLEIISMSESGRREGYKSKSKSVVKLDLNGKVLGEYRSMREAAKYSDCSHATVSLSVRKKFNNGIVNDSIIFVLKSKGG